MHHTCINTATTTDGSVLPPCEACQTNIASQSGSGHVSTSRITGTIVVRLVPIARVQREPSTTS